MQNKWCIMDGCAKAIYDGDPAIQIWVRRVEGGLHIVRYHDRTGKAPIDIAAFAARADAVKFLSELVWKLNQEED